jgi:hypothetical protein
MKKQILVALLTTGALCQATAATAQVDVASSVASAFDSVWVVAIGENHGHAELHDLFVVLLEDARIQAVVDDVVVEFGNALYQDVVDRYTRGETVSADSVRLAWRNTVVSPNPVWDAPMYGRLYEAVRRINGERTDGRAYRLVLGDSPVGWDSVTSRADLVPFYGRSEHMTSTVGREVLRHGRRALLLAGGAHLTRVNMVRRNRAGVPVAEQSVVSRLQAMYPGTLFVVRSLGRTADLDLSGVTEGDGPLIWSTADGPFSAQSANATSTMKNADGSKFDAYGGATLREMVDAIIFWPTDQRTFVDPSPEVFDDVYQAELDRRTQIVRGGSR